MTTAEIHQESFQLLKELVENRCENFDREDSAYEMKSVQTLIKYFESRGITEYEVFEPAPQRASLLIRAKGSDPNAKSIIYESHLDVVPASNSWSRDPFSCEIVDGWIWGRGTLDMLMFTATQAVAFADIITSDKELKGDLIFLAVADEEGSGKFGTKWLCDNVPEKIKGDYLIGEFGGAILATPSGKQKIIVMTSEKSPGWTKLSVKGKPGHASMPYDAVNANSILSEILFQIDKHPPKPVITEAYLEFVEGLELGGLQKFLLTSPTFVDFAINTLAKKDLGTARTLHALTRMTIVPTIIEGGKKINMVSDRATVNFDIRLLPGQDFGTIEAYLYSIIPKEYTDKVEISPIAVDANLSDSFNDPFVEAIGDVCAEIFPQYPITPLFLPAVTDARYFRQIGIKCYGFSLLGDKIQTELLSKFAHGDDERIPVEALQLTHEAYMKLPFVFWNN